MTLLLEVFFEGRRSVIQDGISSKSLDVFAFFFSSSDGDDFGIWSSDFGHLNDLKVEEEKCERNEDKEGSSQNRSRQAFIENQDVLTKEPVAPAAPLNNKVCLPFLFHLPTSNKPM